VLRRNIISYHSSSTLYRCLRRPTRATTTHLGSSLTAAPSSARVTATAPTRVREMPGTVTTAAPRTTSSWRALNRRSRTRSTAAVGTTAVVRGCLATVCRQRRPCYVAAVCVTEAAACWRTAPTPWRGRTLEDQCLRSATPMQR